MSDRDRLHKTVGGLTRIFEAAMARYRDLGRVRGTVRVPELTEEERLALTGFLGTHVSTRPGQTLVLRLDEFSKAFALRQLASDLPEAAALLEGQRIRTRDEDRADTADRWSKLIAFLLQKAAMPRSRAWAEAVSKGEGLSLPLIRREFHEAERSGDSHHHRLRQVLRVVAAALDHLPVDSGGSVRLPVFARDLTGDPHGFDRSSPAGRLLERVLVDCVGPSCGVTVLPSGALERGILLTAAGLLPDGVSSTVACFGLKGARMTDGSPDRQVEGAARDRSILVASLRQIGHWADVRVPDGRVFAVENPAVFEELADHSLAQGAFPCLICTSGFLSVAVVRLLDLAVRQGAQILYGGDFDGRGLAIADGLLRRYGEKVNLWAMGVPEYRIAADHPLAEELENADLSKLDAYRHPQLIDLVAEMKRCRRRAYQEALLPMLKDGVLV